MIVKIIQEKGALFYDGFEKIRYEYKTSEELEQFDTDATWIDSRVTLAKGMVIVGRRKPIIGTDPEFTIRTNGEVYLLNDEGKTIERIN